MGRIQKKEEEKITIEYPVYTARDFFIMKDELEKYAIDKELKKKDGTFGMVHFVPVVGVQKWYIEKGALADREDWAVKNIPLFKELQDKMEQYDRWCRRVEYAQKHNPPYGELQELTNKMNVGE
jgi:hypothetical protein